MRQANVHFFNHSERPPLLEVTINDDVRVYRFKRLKKRANNEQCWHVHPEIPQTGMWQFRIDLGNGTYACPIDGGSFDHFHTRLQTLFVQNGQVYDYEPQPSLTQSRVVKIPHFHGSLPARPLYIYLPRGYDLNHNRRYPVLYMHDGQNCFESFVQDSFAGSWRADEVADQLIRHGKMRECIIVGVGNGEAERIPEYLPPYAQFPSKADVQDTDSKPVIGRADQTAAFYIREVATFVNGNFRTLIGRDDTATCGSSMGGLFSTYLGMEHPGFAAQHGCLSSSYWITGTRAKGFWDMQIIDRITPPSDTRFWIDSGTKDSPDYGDDRKDHVIAFRDALLKKGYKPSTHFRYMLDEGGTHSEASWAHRLPQVFEFLFPLQS